MFILSAHSPAGYRPVSLVRARARARARPKGYPGLPEEGQVGRGQGVHGARPPWTQVSPGDCAGLGVACRS